MYYIYGLLKENRVVYVGQSKNVKARLRKHRNSDKIFDNHIILDESENKNNELENYYIIKHGPMYNKATNKKWATISAKDYFEKFIKCGCEIHQFYECIIHLGVKPIYSDMYSVYELFDVDAYLQKGFTFEERVLNQTLHAREHGMFF